MGDCKEVLLQMQKTDLFCKCISKWLLNVKAPCHKAETFTTSMFSFTNMPWMPPRKFIALVIPKSWCFTELIKAHNKLGHQGVNRTYHLMKWQQYWKGMKHRICKYIANCTLCKMEKVKMLIYPLQMMDILDQHFNKIAIDVITDLNISTSGNQHIITIIDHLMQWPEAFPIPNIKADTIVCVLINNYLPIHMCPRFTLSDNEQNSRNNYQMMY